MSAFVYLWINKNTREWYIGSRTAKNSHINDGYICSSKYVKPLIESNPTDWVRLILSTGSASEMILLESSILQCLDAKNDKLSLNKHNGDGKFTVSGKKVGPMSIDHKKKLSESKKGRVAWNKGLKGVQKHSEKTKEAIRNSRLGKKHSEETKKKISLTERISKSSVGMIPNTINRREI